MNSNTLKIKKILFLPIVLCSGLIPELSQAEITYPFITRIEEYNDKLPYWGTTWQPHTNNQNQYHPSFYTGFAPRVQNPERLHIRQSRGNVTRLSVILDEKVLVDYLFDLVARYEAYKTSKITPLPEQKAVPHLRFFNNIIESPEYDILGFTNAVQDLSDEAIYTKALEVISKLNPGRVFPIRINLTQEFLKWKALVKQPANGNSSIAPLRVSFDEKNVSNSLNSLLWGRINLIQAPSAATIALGQKTAELAASANEDEFLNSALELFKALTGTKYQFKVVENGKFVDALQCPSVRNCFLTYPEFTTMYPTGTVQAWVSDGRGNRINSIASPGLWNFYPNDNRISLDKKYYGFMPRMYYENIGNAYHNPGVKFSGVDDGTMQALGSPTNHEILWAVKRGAVSHGCSRLSGGHTWEMRHILPADFAVYNQSHVFIHAPQDFDLYDVDGNGSLEVMGVEYLISYSYKNNNYDSREAAGLEIGNDKKLSFYTSLYGANDVFKQVGSDFVFINPTVSLPSYEKYKSVGMPSNLRAQLPGEYPLFEQKYEKDKIQLISDTPDVKFLTYLGSITGSKAAALDKKQKSKP